MDEINSKYKDEEEEARRKNKIREGINTNHLITCMHGQEKKNILIKLHFKHFRYPPYYPLSH